MSVSCSPAVYDVAWREGTSSVSSRLSSSHFLRPPSSSLTSWWPYSLKYQYAYAANQLLLPPYSTTVFSLLTPLADRSSSNCCLLTKSRRTWSCRSVVQSSLTAPRMWPLSYAVVSSSTSTSTTFGSSRCCSTQSALTSADSRLMCVLSCPGLSGWLMSMCRGSVGDRLAHVGRLARHAPKWWLPADEAVGLAVKARAGRQSGR